MIGTLYRYPHPQDPTRFIYCGQGPKRDGDHRFGRTSFGRRFKKMFPDAELPQPVREQVEVEDQIELNVEETIWMFRYHTWHGYSGGMNLTRPGSDDYINLGKIAGRIASENGQIQALRQGCSEGGRITGYKHKENKTGIFSRTPEKILEDAKKGGLVAGRIVHEIKDKNGKSIHAQEIGRLGGIIGGRVQGRKNAESGQIQALRQGCSKGGHVMGLIQGRKNVENGHLKSIAFLGGLAAGRKNAENGRMKILLCMRWNVRRGKPCTCGQHQVAV
jgi:hypothetical protein